MHRKQAEALSYLIGYPEIREVLYGGAKGGGKSFLGAFWITSSCLKYAGTSWFVARENLVDLRRHTIPTFFEVFKICGVDPSSVKYNGQDNFFTFSNGSRVLFASTQSLPSDPMYERFGSMQNTGGWLEEAGEIPEAAYQNLKLSIGRCKNEEYGIPFKLLITANPKKNWMYNGFIKRPQPDQKYIQAFARDNIYLPEQYHTTLDGIKDKRDRQRLLMGLWDYDSDDNSLMSYEKIQDLFTNNFVPDDGQMFISSDLALTNDDFVLTVWKGLRIKDIIILNNLGKSSTAGGQVTIDFSPLVRTFDEVARKWNVPRSNIIYDADGIGHHMKSFLPGAIALHSGQNALEREYKNLKANLYYRLADAINTDKIYIDCSLSANIRERLSDELQAVKRDTEPGEKLGLLPKVEVKKLLGYSPDIADAMAYRMLFQITRKT